MTSSFQYMNRDNQLIRDCVDPLTFHQKKASLNLGNRCELKIANIRQIKEAVVLVNI
jgi:hypothetical protein